MTAWQSGDGALANVALDRALDADPRYSMALLLREAISAGALPSAARLPMTPEEVAASYDVAEAAPPGLGPGTGALPYDEDLPGDDVPGGDTPGGPC